MFGKESGQNQECWIVHTFFILYPPPLWDIEDRRRWGHDVEDSDIEDRRRWGQTTLRTGDVEDRRPWGQIHPPIHFPTLGPKGPQKPSNLHIFSNVGSIYPIKYVHSPNRNPQNYIFSPNVGSIYPIKHSSPKCLHHISNILSSMSHSRSDPILWDWKQETWQSVEWKWLPSTLIRRARARTNWHTLGHMRSTLWAVLYCFKLF